MSSEPTFGIAELCYGTFPSLAPQDRALQLAEQIDDAEAMRDRLLDLEHAVDEMDELETENERLRKLLIDLVAAIDDTKTGSVARVGALVVVEQGKPLAESLGEALEAARTETRAA
jgi:hypothetical protein